MKKILEINGELINEGKNIHSTVYMNDNRDNVIKAASLGVAELIRMISKEEGAVSKSELYTIFNLALMKDIFEDVR